MGGALTGSTAKKWNPYEAIEKAMIWPSSEEMSEEENCQRYFAISKKMPKDVKRHCGMCRQHGLLVETRGHHCSWKNCNCSRCLLIRQRRQIMRTQIRLRRAQDKIFQRTSEPTKATVVPQNSSEKDDPAMYHPENSSMMSLSAKNQCYICQKCKNHGILVWKKEHKRHCLYANCTCDQCELIERRRKLDQILKCSSKFKATTHKRGWQSHTPIPMNSNNSSNMISVLANLNKQITEQRHYQNDTSISEPGLNPMAYELLTTRFQLPSRTDLAMAMSGESRKTDTIPSIGPVFPIPLKPQPISFPSTVNSVPTMYGPYSPASALMNTLAAMHYALGIF